MRILSIDFDYFINTTLSVMNMCFPDAEDITDPQKIKEMWNECYLNASIDTIGIIVNEYGKMCEFLKEHEKVPYLVAESHKDIYEFIKEQQMGSDTVLEIVNVDFHHDNYCMYGGQVTCANWLMKICEEVEMSDRILWVKRYDSETVSLAGEFPYPMTDNIEDSFKEYDAIFLCMSPEWTPPHLRDYFNRMAECLK